MYSKSVRTLATVVVALLVGAAAAQAQTTVVASWDRNTDSHTAGYRLFYGTAPGSYQWSFDVGNQVSAPVTLSSGHVYYFTVRAYNSQYQVGPPSAERTFDLRVPNAPTATVSANMTGANSATVTWQSANATSASLNGATVALSGSTVVTVTGATTFTLTVRAADGRTATATATVTPSPPPSGSAPTAEITATLGSGGSARVTWRTTNATTVWIATANAYYAVGPSGTAGVPVNGATTFTLNARAADGRVATAVATVGGAVAPESGPTAEITATLGSNNVARVTWRTTNASTVWIEANGAYYAVGLSGSAGIPVSGTTTFVLSARGANGRVVTASATARR